MEQGRHLGGLFWGFFWAPQGWGAEQVCRGLKEDLQAVGRGQALFPVEQALPPALAFWHVLLQNGQDVPSAEGQLVQAVRVVVIEGSGQQRLVGVGRAEEKMGCYQHGAHASVRVRAATPLPSLPPRVLADLSLPTLGDSGDELSHPRELLPMTLAVVQLSTTQHKLGLKPWLGHTVRLKFQAFVFTSKSAILIS